MENQANILPNNNIVESDSNRIFSRFLKEKCWEKAEKVPGRDPARWRMDPAGNIVSYKLRGCDGCLCHEYDHIVPFSKGGPTSLENCQILQTRPNRFKGNEDNDVFRLKGYSCARQFNEAELDLVEMALYGSVKRDGLECRCRSKFEVFQEFQDMTNSLSKKKPNLPDCPYFHGDRL